MKAFAALSLLCALATSLFAQARPIGDKGVYRIYIKHADPWFIKAMLEGTAVNQPELSTILGFAGIPDKESSLLESLFGVQGRLVVDPTDNSLIFFPKK